MMQRLTPVVKNIVIINVIVFIAQGLVPSLTGIISLHKLGAESFAPYQFFTYMFAHGGFFHIFFNMLMLFFLGPLLEQFWGSNRFVFFYLVCGLGAGFIYNGIEYIRTEGIKSDVETYITEPSPSNFNRLIVENVNYPTQQILNFIDTYDRSPNSVDLREQSILYAKSLYNQSVNLGSMLGASGAVYGILMAFGLLFPNTELMLLFPPIPVKAKYLVLVLGGIALFSGFNRSAGDNVAHFAHLGGMVFAFIMIKFWQNSRDRFY